MNHISVIVLVFKHGYLKQIGNVLGVTSLEKRKSDCGQCFFKMISNCGLVIFTAVS